jgi:hypothetical protein
MTRAIMETEKGTINLDPFDLARNQNHATGV